MKITSVLLLIICLSSCGINHSKLIMQNILCLEHLHIDKIRNQKILNSKIDSVLKAIDYSQKEYGGCDSDDSATYVKYIIRNEAGENIGAHNILIENLTKVKYAGQSFMVY
jgi:hypothetical protein